MQPSKVRQSINIYLEDKRAKHFLVYLLSRYLGYNFENYFNIVDVDLGFSNYLHLHKKKVPEFLNSLIVLDHDVHRKASELQLNYMEETLDGVEKMYDFWCGQNENSAREFVVDFINAYNLIADKMGYDYMMGISK